MAKPKNRELLQRRRPRREPYDRVLIVCEGAQTEPNYLRELVRYYQLSSANVEITGDSGSAPMSVVEYAIQRFEADPDYNSVFCVFDRDQHSRYGGALERIRTKKLVRRDGRRKLGTARFEAVTSVPCFEYWILLHYRYTTTELARFGDVHHLLRQIPEQAGYAKGAQGLFVATRTRLDDALSNADRANAEAARNNTDNPTTRIPVLIRYLMDLARKKQR